MKEIYSWVPWFTELCERVANNGPEFLAERARRIPWRENDEAPLLRHGDDNIDPFSFVYSLAAHQHARQRVYASVAQEFELKSELPLEMDEAFIFPTPPPVTALFHDSGKGDPVVLGRLFRSAVSGIDAVSVEDFERAQRIGGVAAAKLTQALFLINAHEFLPYDNATQSLQSDPERQHQISWEGYRAALGKLLEAFPGCRPYEINLLAYETSKNDDPLTLNAGSLWQISTRVYGNNDPRDMWEDFEQENCAYTGGPGGGQGSWDEYDPATGILTYNVADPRRGDVVLVRNGRIGHGVGIVWRNDYAKELSSDARLHLLWLCKDDTQLEGSWAQQKAFTRAHKIGDAFREAYPQAFAFLDRVAGGTGQEIRTNARRTPHGNDIRVPTTSHALNTIFYGPPGTGKTYRTISRSVEICDGIAPEGEDDLRARYDELVREERIAFVTFHQSYGYEEFVEGIRPVVKAGQVVYQVEDGILKRMAADARADGESGTMVASPPSFDDVWAKLLEHAQQRPVVRTKNGDKEYTLTLDGDWVVFAPNDLGEERRCSKENARKLWDHSRGKAPHDVTPKEIEDGILGGRRNDASYLWIIYKEMWCLACGEGQQASTPPSTGRNFVLVIDEINRANISKVMGELITLLEEDKRQHARNELGATLPYSRERFLLPGNLHILGTMNTADRSIALLDTALRRRFDFEEIAPDPARLEQAKAATGVDLPRVLETINQRLEYLVDRDHLIGHGWLMQAKGRHGLDEIMRRKIIPLIAEYFYDDWNKVRAVLGATDDFVERVELQAPPGLDEDTVEKRYQWTVRSEFADDAYERLVEAPWATQGSG